MTFLLDTNVLVYGILEPTRITRAASEVIASGELYAAAASIYEVGNKHRTGKLPIPPGPFRERVGASGVSFVPMDAAVAELASSLEWSHRDPWDRIIAAQALALGAALVSSDRAYDAVPGLTRLW